MECAAEIVNETVRVTRRYKFSRGKVYEAWTNVEALGQWFGPPSHKCRVEKFDLCEGGQYRIRMVPIGAEDTDCGGDSDKDSICAGKFVQIQPPEKLVMTFSWVENGADIGETLLSVELLEVDNETEVVIIHERLPNEAMRKAHTDGWQGSLECLVQYLLE